MFANADDGALVVFDAATLWAGGARVFARTQWAIRPGEQWCILGPNGSGKSLLIQALLGQGRLAKGEIRWNFADAAGRELDPQDAVAVVSPLAQRELIRRESSFYQSRWHSGIEEGENTVARFLSQSAVEEINPFEVKPKQSNARAFAAQRRALVRQLGLAELLQRKILFLSNGEQRKVLLAHALLRAPRLLILDDPFAGLDGRTRQVLARMIAGLMRQGLPLVFVTHRPDEIPAGCTHVLVVENQKVVAQGKKSQVRLPKFKRIAPPENRPLGIRPPRSLKAAGPLIELNRVTIKAGNKMILRDISWQVLAGENWAVLGPNGAGKTTLLGLLQGDHPQAFAHDIRLFDGKLLAEKNLWEVRQQIGAVSPELHQHYPLEWSCLEVVCSGFQNTLGLFWPCSRRQVQLARQWLADFGLREAEGQPLGALSIGHQRLVLVARAMVKGPRLLILDEPCQGVDGAHRQTILATVDRIVEQTGVQVLFVTHHPDEMPRCVTQVLRLKKGRVEQRTANGERRAPNLKTS